MLALRLVHARTLCGILAVISVSCFPPSAVGDGPLLTSSGTRIGDSTGMRGYSFDVGHELIVTGLAKFDGNRNGLLDDLGPPQIGIWNTQTSELIVSDFYICTAQHDLWPDQKGQWIGTYNAAPAHKLYKRDVKFSSPKQPTINQPIVEIAIGYHVRSGLIRIGDI